jgi:hypothetical protein
MVSRRQLRAESLPKYNHHNDQRGNTQVDKSTSNEHILETIGFHPRRDGERDSNTDGVPKKRDCCECVTDYLYKPYLSEFINITGIVMLESQVRLKWEGDSPRDSYR